MQREPLRTLQKVTCYFMRTKPDRTWAHCIF